MVFGETISDPIALLSKVEGVWGIAAALVGLTLATLTTNLAANIIAPVNALIALSPRTFTFGRAALLTSAAGVLIMPWRLISSTSSFYAWLVRCWCWLVGLAGLASSGCLHRFDSPSHNALCLLLPLPLDRSATRLYWAQWPASCCATITMCANAS